LSEPAVYTAFGENARGLGGTRYQYAGSSGYESGLLAGGSGVAGLPWQHVGHRWYDPSTGRFLQRDPIGIEGGMNIYEYVDSNSTDAVDPSGLDRWIVGGVGHVDLVVDDPWAPPGVCVTAGFWSKTWANGTSSWRWVVGDGGTVKRAISTTPKSSIVVHITSTPEQDKELVAWINDQEKNPPPYIGWLGYCCHTWANDGLRVGMPPPPPPPGFTTGGYWNACFVAGTTVLTPWGTKSIEEILKSDTVFTTDLDRNSLTLSDITWSGINGYVHELVDVHVCGAVIRSTCDQPYWTTDRGWLCARDLRPGDLLRDPSGMPLVVECVELVVLEEAVPVYDISVAGYRWFFVGPCGVLVHNT
jgi:RHS repeat-associated protein